MSNKLNFYIILRDIIKNFWIIVMAGIIGFLSVSIYAKDIRVPEYTASSTLVVSAKSTTYANAYAALSTASSMAGVLKEVFESDILMEKVEEEIGNVPADVSVTANVISGTNLLVLSVSSKDPKVAYAVCNSVLKHYDDISDYLFSNAVLEVVAEPEIPTRASNIFRINLFRCLAALAFAAVITAAIIFFCVTRKTIKNISDVEDSIEGEFLGVIPHEKKGKTFKSFFKKVRKTVLINEPLCSFTFEENNNKFAENLRFEMDKNNYKTVLISSVAENEGKSTISTNLAIALGRLGKKVLIVDVDFRKPALYKIMEMQDEKQRKDLVTFIDGKCGMESVIHHNVYPKVSAALNYGAKKKSTLYIRSPKLKEFFDYAEKEYDYIIMDSSPIAVGTDVQLISDIAESAVIVVRHDFVRIAHINDAIEEVKEGKSEYLGFVVNDYRGFNMRLLGQSAYGGYGKYGYNYGYGSANAEKVEE